MTAGQKAARTRRRRAAATKAALTRKRRVAGKKAAATRRAGGARRAATLLMFQQRNAEEAMGFYASVFPGARIAAIERYGAEEGEREGTVKRADFDLRGHALVFIDSPPVHAFTFTPSISIYVDCVDAAELERAFAALSAGGQVFMPLDDYGFSARFGWVADRYGVSWQLNLP